MIGVSRVMLVVTELGHLDGSEQDIVNAVRHYQGKLGLWKLASPTSIPSKLLNKATAEQAQQQMLPHATLPPRHIKRWQMAFFSLYMLLEFKFVLTKVTLICTHTRSITADAKANMLF